ncbi:MAG: 1-deoxy-D-xylulose-5-phosphate synthase N-terminal domain-containing protein [Ilumatobacteraceae bacterium]
MKAASQSPVGAVDINALERIEQRVLWLAVRMVDYANRERPISSTPDGRDAQFALKVGGHIASSASVVSIMTSLWFGYLNGDDKVSVKPHASPIFHAIKYLTGELDRSYLTKLRSLGGLQAYPSRTKDPDVADFSTGSVGLGAVAPLFASMARRYIDAHFGPKKSARFIALIGDAELDEGNIWEAITDPSLQGLSNVMWIVDANRQSLDRVIPGMKIKKLAEFFADAGWHVVEAKYGRKLESAFARPGGTALRKYIDEMSNERYQSLFALQGSDLRAKFLQGAPKSVHKFIAEVTDDDIAPLVQNLGGHDLSLLLDCYRQCDLETERPSVVFAYTVKGWGLPIAGDPLNHAALLTANQIDAFRSRLGLTLESEFDRFVPESEEDRICREVGEDINNLPLVPRPQLPIPNEIGLAVGAKPMSTQEVFGRLLTGLGGIEGVGERIVTTSPDVSVSTNLGGWINKFGVFHSETQPDYLGEDRLLRWQESPRGRHIELGISEMNLFLTLHAFGLGHELHGEHLLPIGTLYDPFVCRGLDALVYALYNGARFIVVGTPAGITLAPEGGAHQSTITASIGMELPNITYAEPCYARALDWLLCDGLKRLGSPDGDSLYLRLSTRPIDQAPFEQLAAERGRDALRADVLNGGYRLVEPQTKADVIIAATGPVAPEAVAAAELLAVEGLSVLVLDLTSPDRLYRQWRGGLRRATRTGTTPNEHIHLSALIAPHERHLPIVTLHDAASHTLAWLGSVYGTTVVPVGVDEFGQSGTIAELYEVFDLLPEQIVNATLVALS